MKDIESSSTVEEVEDVQKTVQLISDSNQSVASAIARTNELLTMSLYMYIVFFVFFALHRFAQAKRRK